MGNRDTEAAWSYHEATKHSRESVRTASGFLDWDNEPLPFKLYLDLEPIPLPEQRKPLAVSALESIASTVSAREGHAVPDLEMLAHLFYLSAGITK
ncbi:MAG: dehydrogenase, partial [Acidobacteriota bacterium]